MTNKIYNMTLILCIYIMLTNFIKNYIFFYKKIKLRQTKKLKKKKRKLVLMLRIFRSEQKFRLICVCFSTFYVYSIESINSSLDIALRILVSVVFRGSKLNAFLLSI